MSRATQAMPLAGARLLQQTAIGPGLLLLSVIAAMAQAWVRYDMAMVLLSGAWWTLVFSLGLLLGRQKTLQPEQRKKATDTLAVVGLSSFLYGLFTQGIGVALLN